MTAFTTANIPSSVNTLEELMCWAASAIAEINPTVTVQTSSSTAEPVCSCQPFRFANQATNPERLVVVAYLPLTAPWRSAGKLFGTLGEVSQTALPAAYTTN
jgi:hypothetical protein